MRFGKLRQLEEKDTEGMWEWMSDLDFQKYFRFSLKNKTQRETIEFIRKSETIPQQDGNVNFAIVNSEDEYMGTISLKNIDFLSYSAEYAISLRKIAQGTGIATAATKEILRIAFEDWNFHRVYLNVFSDNYRAIRFYEKCGFIFEGEWREHIFIEGEYRSLKHYAILRREYYSDNQNH